MTRSLQGGQTVTVSQLNSESSSAVPRCQYCRDVIGAYEPLVMATPSGRHDSSLTAEPQLYGTDHPCYHRACYEQGRPASG
jgi:hypothetical protein